MSSRFTNRGLLLLGSVLALSSARDTAAEEEDSISIVNPAWTAAGMLGAAEGQTAPFRSPGVHVRLGEYTSADREGPIPLLRNSLILDSAAISRVSGDRRPHPGWPCEPILLLSAVHA